MPQTDFILMPDDEERIIRHAFSLGIEIVPNLNFDSRDVPAVSAWEQYWRLRELTPLFFLFSDKTLVSPFQSGELKERGRYYVMQRFGGPYISFLNYSPTNQDGNLILPAGSLSYYPTYYNSLTGEEAKPSSEFRQLYRSLVSEIKQDASRATCLCFDGSTRVYWLTPKVRDALQSGAKPKIEGLEI